MQTAGIGLNHQQLHCCNMYLGFLVSSNKVIMHLGAISNRCLSLENKTLLELLKRSRSSALIDGICMGIGFIFIVFGIVIPTILHTYEQIINGLLAIIGGIVVTSIGGIMEVYHWARMPLLHLQESEEESVEGVFLRCEKCGKKTAHFLINAVKAEKGKIEETYECMQCGERKKVYELTSAIESGPALKQN